MRVGWRALAVVLACVLVVGALPAGLGLVGAGAAAPPGMSTIPDAAVSADVPANESIALEPAALRDGRVLASDHAGTLEVVLTTAGHADAVMDSDAAAVSGDGLALVLRDDTHSAGRSVALDAGVVRDALGYRPQALYGTHENGTEWTASATYRDGFLVFDVPHFSSNTVTFSGEVEIDATGATDGTQFQYGIGSLDTASDPQVTLTGSTNTEWDNVSATGLDPSGSTMLSVGGNAEPTDSAGGDPVLSVTGYASAYDLSAHTDPRTTDVSGATSGSAVNGIAWNDDGSTLYLTDVNGGEIIQLDTSTAYDPSSYNLMESPTLSVDSSPAEIGFNSDGSKMFVQGDETDKLYQYDLSTAYDITSRSQTDSLGLNNYAGGFAWNSDGTKLYVSNGYDGNINQYSLSAPYDLSTASKARTLSVSESVGGGLIWNDDGTRLYIGDYSNVKAYSVSDPYNVSTAAFSETIDLSPEFGSMAAMAWNGDGSEISMTDKGDETITTYATLSEVEGLSVSDGAGTSVSLGNLSDGETKTTPIDLSTSSSTLDLSATGGSSIDLSLTMLERTETTDPAIEINDGSGAGAGEWLNYTGTLSDGVTTSLTASNTSLQSGTNHVNVSLGDGTLSADAPNPQVEVNYSHDATDKVTTDYTTTAFEERYNVSRTFADATADAQVTIPFTSSRIVSIANLDYRINETGGWSDVSATNYRLNGTTLDVFLDDAYGGPLPAGATVEVRATGRRIDVENGAVTVTDATKPGDELDTEIRVDERSEGFAVNVGPTDDGKRVHYAYSSDYPTQDYVVITADGDQDLHMPEAVVDDRVRISHIDAMVNATRGDVRIDVTEPGSDPELEVSPGPGGDGDPVTVKYYRTETGVKYLLNSLTRNIVLDSDVAESPAIFEDDDSSETWAILEDDGGNTSSGGGGGGGPVAAAGQFAAQTGQTISGALAGQALLVVGGLVGVVGVVLVGRRIFGGDDSEPAAPEPTSTTPDNGGGGGGLGGRVTGAVGGLVGFGRRAGGGLVHRGPRLVGGLARRAGRLLVAIGQGLLNRTGQLVRALAANRAASIALAVIASVAAVGTGFVSVPREVIILVVVAGVPVATYAALKRAGIYSRTVWLGSTVIAAVIGIEFAAPGVLGTAIEQLTSENVAPLLIIAIAGLGYLYLQARKADASTADTVNRIVLGGGGDE